MSVKSVQLTQELNKAGFLNWQSVKNRARRLWRAGKETPPIPESRGAFQHYADTRAGGRVRHKFEVRAHNEGDAQEAIDIANVTVPDAYTWLSPNKEMATITWTE